MNFCQWLFSSGSCLSCPRQPCSKSSSRAVKPISGTGKAGSSRHQSRAVCHRSELGTTGAGRLPRALNHLWGTDLLRTALSAPLCVLAPGRATSPSGATEQQPADSPCSQTCLTLPAMPSRCFPTVPVTVSVSDALFTWEPCLCSPDLPLTRCQVSVCRGFRLSVGLFMQQFRQKRTS